MFKYNPCPQCGDYVEDIWWNGVIEYDGKSEQSCSINCSNCNFEIIVTIDADGKLDSHKIELVLKETWNKLYELSE